MKRRPLCPRTEEGFISRVKATRTGRGSLAFDSATHEASVRSMVAISGLQRLPTEFDRTMRWARDAACRDEDPELFFPLPVAGGKGSVLAKRQRLATAKAICGRCPVLRECRKHALELPEEYGICGGLTEEERVKLRISHGDSVCGRRTR
jgi:WhiB family transcriptional regulator, redox-sensing transcriptional regulator